MNITEITASCSTSFNHPSESYSNFKPGVTLKATLAPGEDEQSALTRLQSYAYQSCVSEKVRILKAIHIASEEEQLESEISRHESLLRESERVTSLPVETQQAEYNSWFDRFYGSEHFREKHSFEKFMQDTTKMGNDALVELARLRARLAELKALPF